MKKFIALLMFLFCSQVWADLTDIKFGQSQIADSQWNVSACLYTTTCQIYSKAVGTMYKIPWTSGQWSWQSGQYVQFSLTGNATNPYEGKVYNSNGTLAGTIGTGHIVNMGPDYFFFVGNDNNTGQLFSGSTGMSGSGGVSWTGTLNPTIAQANTYANATYSTVPLSAGQTATSTPSSSSPTVVSTSQSYTTRTVVSGNTTTIYRTPVTTTTYSDNTTTTTTGTETLYQTRVASSVTTNRIVNGVLTTYSTPIVKVTPGAGGATTIEANGSQTVTSQNVTTGLDFEVWRYDSKTYSCGWLGCIWDLGRRIPSTNRSDYGNPVNSGRTTSGIFIATNSDLPNNDNSIIGQNDNTVIRYRGTITAPITNAKPAGTVYRLYFYNNSDDGFRMYINGVLRIDQASTNTWQSLFGYTNSGYMDVVAGQTYNIEAWYWNVLGGFGMTLYWDFGDGVRTIPNSAFTNGTIANIDIDATGLSYSNATVVPIEGTASVLWPESDGITNSQLSALNAARARQAAMTLGNRIDLEVKVGSSNPQVTIEQSGNYNLIQGLGGGNAIIDGDNNTVNIKQGSVSGRNLIEFSIVGNTNTVTIWQARDQSTGMAKAPESGGHYTGLDLSGNNNTVTMKQSNDGAASSGHFSLLTVAGSTNTISISQANDNEKRFFGTVNGNTNSLTATQQGAGSHYLDITLTGNGQTATVLQKDAASHKATVNLINAGGANSLNLTQQGATAQSINITQQCANAAGCSITVTQQ